MAIFSKPIQTDKFFVLRRVRAKEKWFSFKVALI
jgi:hypothetical protein